MSKLNSKLYNAPTDQSGKEIQFDIREDEEQQKKLQETLELLVAAGYFRARIKGLSAFDKIVGGMTWCITTCNFDVDVDLLFQESSTIGQKITLTERIVSVLPRMKCPHAIEPHQIQGLDFIHIYPVIQWLVKKAIETRAEMGDLNRSFALLQFSKMDCEPPTEVEQTKQEKAVKTFNTLKDQNAPQRKYLRKDVHMISDRQVKVQSTLLEYGQQQFLLSSILSQQQQQSQQTSGKGLKQAQEQQQKQQAANAEAEEANLKRLMGEMSTADQKQNRVTANAVGQILGLQQSTLQQIVDEFTSKENELQQEMELLEKMAGDGEGLGGMQQKQRYINILNKQIQQRNQDIGEKQAQLEKLKETATEMNDKLNSLKEIAAGYNEELARLEEYEKNVDKKSVEKLQELVKVNQELKQKEQEYKKTCKEELAKLETEIEKLKAASSGVGQSEESEKYEKINEQYEATKAKLQALRIKVAKKNREISLLKRKLDEVPSRIELTQYQKRFVELYNQISAVHTQTKQFYIFYNVLEDKKTHMNKEISLLNSIHDQFAQAMSTPGNREQFVKQLENIWEGIKQNLSKLDNRKTEKKTKCDQLNDKFNDLIEKKRIYYKTLKDFQEECKKNEILVSKMQG